jgi:tetratricopeptide (TPR) repeat protein
MSKRFWLAIVTALAPCPALAQDGPPAMPMGSAHAHEPAGTPAAEIKAEGAPELHQSHAGHAHDDTVVPDRPTLLRGYGNGGFTVSTTVPEAQAFFSNGMELGAAFAHPAAIAAMQEAVRLDPACAMCKWGEALVDGPTINYGKDAKERVPLRKLAREAEREAKASGTPREQALTVALVQRYRAGKVERRDSAYAEAMRKVQRAYPQDDEVAVLTADALLQASFAGDEPDMPTVKEAVALLEQVLARSPNHTPAIHFYIHATEIAGEAGKAEPYADRLESLAPRASHLVHMPSHTFYWLGRYQEAADANRRAVAIGVAQAKALGTKAPEGVWGLPYHMHNVIFGMGGALMAGDAKTALDLARPMVAAVQARTDDDPIGQLLAASGYYAIARFDAPSVAALPEPKGNYLKAAWHYARGEAAAQARDAVNVRVELAAIPATLLPAKAKPGPKAPEQMLGIMRHVLEGRAAMIEGKPADAATAFTAAADIEETRDFNQFSDPPAFWYPVRRDVAVAKLAAGDAPGAVAAAEASLKLRPRDPAALDTLAKAKAALPAT